MKLSRVVPSAKKPNIVRLDKMDETGVGEVSIFASHAIFQTSTFVLPWTFWVFCLLTLLVCIESQKIFTIGLNSHGQLGLDFLSTKVVDYPVEIRFNDKNLQRVKTAKHLAVGESHTFYLIEDSRTWGVGSNLYGELAIVDKDTERCNISRSKGVPTSVVADKVFCGHNITIVVDGTYCVVHKHKQTKNKKKTKTCICSQ